jgi:hypothetical protein
MTRPAIIVGAILLALLVTAGIFFSWRSRRVISTPIVGLQPEAPLRVGPLNLSEGSALVIVTPELHAKIDATGSARLYRVDPERLPGQAPPEIMVALGEAGWKDLLLELGRLKAAWTTRTVGEAAAGDALSPSDTPSAVILVEEESPGGDRRNHLRLRPNDPEYEELRRILTPLKIGQ